MSTGFATKVKAAAENTAKSPANHAGGTNEATAKAPNEGATTGALTATDSLRQRAAKGAAGLAKVEKEAKRLLLQEATQKGRQDAKDEALAYAVGNLDEAIAAKSEVTLQLQAGKAKINSATDAELIAFVEAGIEDVDQESAVGNLQAYSVKNGLNTQPLNLLDGIF